MRLNKRVYLGDGGLRNRWVSCCYLVVFIPDNALFLGMASKRLAGYDDDEVHDSRSIGKYSNVRQRIPNQIPKGSVAGMEGFLLMCFTFEEKVQMATT